jgi:hypothetical protein
MLAREIESGSSVMVRGRLATLIYRALVRTVGKANAEAVEFYVDTRLAIEDPAAYERSVKLLLGEHGGSLLIGGLKTEVARAGGVERSGESFFSQVRAAERALRRPTERLPTNIAEVTV